VTTLVANIRRAQQWVCGGCGIAGGKRTHEKMLDESEADLDIYLVCN